LKKALGIKTFATIIYLYDLSFRQRNYLIEIRQDKLIK
jgi:hypothetical protein